MPTLEHLPHKIRFTDFTKEDKPISDGLLNLSCHSMRKVRRDFSKKLMLYTYHLFFLNVGHRMYAIS